MVVKPLPMIVVTTTEVIVEPCTTVVDGSCSIVRVIVAEQAQDVS
jgi:hypothetical protein